MGRNKINYSQQVLGWSVLKFRNSGKKNTQTDYKNRQEIKV